MSSGTVLANDYIFFQLSDTNELMTCKQTDLEEAKAQEVSKLQNSMEALQAKLDETNTKLAKEREAAKTIEEAPPVVQETQVLVQDTEKIDSLTTEVQELKVRLPTATVCPEFPTRFSNPFSTACMTPHQTNF